MKENDGTTLSLGDRRVLWLTKSESIIRAQLKGHSLESVAQSDLLDSVSSDAFPTQACFRFDSPFLAAKALTGLKIGPNETVPDDAIANGGYSVLVAGDNFGIGSAREQFPESLKIAGIELIVAKSVAEFCKRNCDNIGLWYLEGNQFPLLYKLLSGDNISVQDVIKGKDPISAEIVKAGGLFPYFAAHPNFDSLPKPETGPRPMTGYEKIMARAMGVPYVGPGDSGFAKINHRESYEIFTAYSYDTLKKNQPNAQIEDPSSVYVHYDHSVFDPSPDAFRLAERQRQIARTEGFTLYDGDKTRGSEGICHLIMLDNHVLPRDVTVGTDSHTTTIAANSSATVVVGATEFAAALWTNRVKVTLPETVRIELGGTLKEGTMAKDIMLYLLQHPYIKDGHSAGQIMEFTGKSFLDRFPFDEQAVLTNMSSEAKAASAYMTPNDQSIRFVKGRFGLTDGELKDRLYYSDAGADYATTIFVPLPKVGTFVALPGSPNNGVPIEDLIHSNFDRKLTDAFIGSCTGSKLYDLIAAAKVLEGQKVHPDMKLVVQAGSRNVFEQAQKMGLIKIFQDAGAEVFPSGCAGCVNMGPGSVGEGHRGISSSNRNFYGRMGKGDVFLANPAVVAASAIAGEVTSPYFLKNSIPGTNFYPGTTNPST